MFTHLRNNLLHNDQPKNIIILAGLIIFLGVMGIFATELPLPSLPAIAFSFHTTTSKVQLSFTTYLLGMALSHFFYGPMSDRYGRRRIIFGGLLINAVGCLLSMSAHSIGMLIASRLIQGIGIGAPMCLTRSVARDVFNESRLAKIGSYLSMVFSLAPVIAPVIGGYIQHWFGWRANFLFLFLTGTIVWILIWLLLPETNPHPNLQATQFKVVTKNYKTLLKHSAFMAYLWSSSAAISGIIVYYAISPFLLQNELGLSPIIYGWLAIFSAGGMLFGRFFNTFLLSKFSINPLIMLGNILLTFAGLVLLLFSCLQIINVWTIVFAATVFIIGGGFISNSMAGAFAPFAKMAGTAGALFGGVQLFVTFVSAILVAAFRPTQMTLAIALTLLGLFALITFYVGVWRKKNSLG